MGFSEGVPGLTDEQATEGGKEAEADGGTVADLLWFGDERAARSWSR